MDSFAIIVLIKWVVGTASREHGRSRERNLHVRLCQYRLRELRLGRRNHIRLRRYHRARRRNFRWQLVRVDCVHDHARDRFGRRATKFCNRLSRNKNVDLGLVPPNELVVDNLGRMGNVLLRWRLIMIGVPVAMNTAMILLGAGLGSLTGESGAGGPCTGNWLAGSPWTAMKPAKVLKMMRISSTDCVLVPYLVKDSTVVLVNVRFRCSDGSCLLSCCIDVGDRNVLELGASGWL
jgi:hypothetical protein